MALENLSFRRGSLKDLPRVKEICKDVWEGHDYIPAVWVQWLANPAYLIFMVEINKRVAGFYALGIQKGSESKAGWWMGVRVAEDFKRRGLARQMAENAFQEAKRNGLDFLRFATNEFNQPMHRIAGQLNFRLVNYYSLISTPYAPESLDGLKVKKLTEEDLESGWNFIISSSDWQSGEGLVCDSWTWLNLEQADFKARVKNGLVYGIQEGSQFSALGILYQVKQKEKSWYFVSWLDGELEGVAVLARFFQGLASKELSPEVKVAVSFMLVKNPQRDKLFRDLGFEVDSGDLMRVFELKTSLN